MTKHIDFEHIRDLARRDGSDLVQQASDAIVDRYISENVGKPAATASWLASTAAIGAEFDSLCRRLQEALGDGSVLDVEAADDKAMRVFKRVRMPECIDEQVRLGADAVGHQQFLARRLYTLASDIVDDTGADIDANGKARAVTAVIHVMAGLRAKPAREVVMALPADEWQPLAAAWKRITSGNRC